MANKNENTQKEADVKMSQKKQPSDTYKKLLDNPADLQDDYRVSTADNSANGKYFKTGVRKEDKDASNRQSN